MLRRTEHDTKHLYIVEVYYEDTVEGSVIGWTDKEFPWADEEYDGVEGLRQTLTWMLECLDKPILDEATLLAEAEAHPSPLEDWDGETLSLNEVLESLGLDREDVEGRWEDDGGSGYVDEEISPTPGIWPDQD